MLFPTLFKLHLDTRCFILYRAPTISPSLFLSLPAPGERFEIANDSVMKRSANKQTDSNFPLLIEMEMGGSIFYRGLTNVQRRNFKSEELLFSISPPSGRFFLFKFIYFFIIVIFFSRTDPYQNDDRLLSDFFVKVWILWISVNVSFNARGKNFCLLEKEWYDNF